jgi:hypothetical protein
MKQMKSLFKQDEMPQNVLGEEATELTSIKLNAFANFLNLNPYGSDGIFKQKLYPISNNSIEPLLVCCPTSYCCMDGACQPRSLLMLTCTNQIPEVTLIKSIKVFKNVLVLSAHCPRCETCYFVDHETYGPSNDKQRAYLNDAVYLKIGQPVLGYPGQLAIWFEYTYIDNHWLYLSAQYYHNLLSSNSCHSLYYLEYLASQCS